VVTCERVPIPAANSSESVLHLCLEMVNILEPPLRNHMGNKLRFPTNIRYLSRAAIEVGTMWPPPRPKISIT